MWLQLCMILSEQKFLMAHIQSMLNCILQIAHCQLDVTYAWVPLGIFVSAMVKCIVIHAMLPDALRF